MTSSTLSELLATQASLIEQASLALPHSFSHCTYPRGPIRQSIYLCLTCSPPPSSSSSSSNTKPTGICSACSIACHTNHNQLELFAKRNFQCDCPTSSVPCACTLHKTEHEPNETNVYGRNFIALFCRCGRPYDPTKEREDMIQCLACEDWYHESCLNLRERPSSREPTPAPEPEPPVQDSDETSSTSSLPPPLLSSTSYDTLICASCVSSLPILSQYAGTPGVLMVIRDDAEDSQWKVLDTENEQVLVVEREDEETDVGVKRTRPTSPSNQPTAKRVRSSPSSQSTSQPPECRAPPRNPLVQSLLPHKKQDENTSTSTRSRCAGDIFLTEGWRERWCRCSSCLPFLLPHPYLLNEEETYEPPEDPDSGLSLEELGLRALSRLPRDKAIDGILAFNGMRDDLVKFLRPFAQEGKEVKEEDVRTFFDDLKAGRKG